MDEPTSSLSVAETEQLFQVMRKLKGDNVGIIFITHFINQVYEISDRITVIRNGTLVGTWETASLPRMELIVKMIGKSITVLDEMLKTKAETGKKIREELVLEALGEKQNLGIHSLMILDVMKKLAEKGVITNRKKGFNEGKMVASGAIGSEELYRYLNGNPAVEFRPCDYVSNPVMIARHHKMTAVNRVTSIDLKGQVAADGSAQNHFADVAGLVDFSRGAAMGPGGKSIVVVPAASEDGLSSNIVLEQAAGTVAIPAADVTYVVTEYGAVKLFGKNVQERAMAMINVAHHNHYRRF